MHKNFVKIIIIYIFLAVGCYPAEAYDRGDFQIWNTESEDIKIYKGTKFVMEQEFRFGENASEFFYQHYEFDIVYCFAKMLDLAFGYRLVYEKVKRKWMEEDMPVTMATLKHELWNIKLEDRNRIEYRHFRFKDDMVRYRNKFTAKYPLEFKQLTVLPYAADEIFVVSNSAGYNENRFSAGAEFALTKYVKADIFYMLKSNKIRDYKWTFSNVLGTKLKIAF